MSMYDSPEINPATSFMTPSLTPFTPMDILGIGAVTPFTTQTPDFIPTTQAMGRIGQIGRGGLSGFLDRNGIGANLKTFNGAIQGLTSLGNLWAGAQQLKLAKSQFDASRDFANINLANQTKSYNTAVADRARSRGAMEGQSQSQVDDYIARNSLQDRQVR